VGRRQQGPALKLALVVVHPVDDAYGIGRMVALHAASEGSTSS
jgi:hypothetical protein